MAVPVPLRPDFDAAALRRAAQRSRHASQKRRLLALAAIYDGASRSDAAVVGQVTPPVVRDWVLRFNAHGPDGLIDRKSPGAPSRLGPQERQALVAKLEKGPVPAVDGVERWRLSDLVQWLSDQFQIAVSIHTVSRQLRAMGYRTLSMPTSESGAKRGHKRRHNGASSLPTLETAPSREAATDSNNSGIWPSSASKGGTVGTDTPFSQS